MKMSLTRNRAENGSALVIAIVVGTLMLLAVASYLTLVNHENFMSGRSQTWNTSIAVVEAGIEEALQHLNTDGDHLATQGWTFDGTKYVLEQDMGDGNGYSVSIDASTDPFSPKIVSTAVTTLDNQALTPMFGALGLDTTSSAVISRAVEVHAKRGNLFIKAMVAKKSIAMNGNNILTDSFDSADPTKSTNSEYDPAKAGCNGDVAVNSSIVNGIGSGNANIYGHVGTGPGGSVAVGPNGGVGDKAFQASNPGQIQEGWDSDNMNFTFPDTTLPYRTGLLPQPGDIVSTEVQVTSAVYTNPPPAGTSGVITNAVYTWATNYPGSISGLITNLTTQTTTSAPPILAVSGPIITNRVQQTVSSWPGTGVGPVTTNTVLKTSTEPPPSNSKLVTTNYTTITDTQLPSPLPSGLITTNTTPASSTTYPTAGTYVGTVTQKGSKYTYDLIVSYSWQVTSYSWIEISYAYYQDWYTFTIASYGIPTYSFNWTVFTTNIISTTNHYDNILYSGNYVVSTLTGSTYVAGDANLVVLNDIKMSGHDVIKISDTGKIHAYVDGVKSTISGNGIVNDSGIAANCIIEFTPNVTSVAFTGNGEFIGVMVASSATLTLAGGGKSYNDFIGAVVANIINMRGHYKFHYDEALGRLGGNGRFLADSWNEIKVGSE